VEHTPAIHNGAGYADLKRRETALRTAINGLMLLLVTSHWLTTVVWTICSGGVIQRLGKISCHDILARHSLPHEQKWAVVLQVSLRGERVRACTSRRANMAPPVKMIFTSLRMIGDRKWDSQD